MIKLRINRKKWGTGMEGGTLLDENTGKMCCLGFACRDAGYTRDDIENLGLPHEAAVVLSGFKDYFSICYVLSLRAKRRLTKSKLLQKLVTTDKKGRPRSTRLAMAAAKINDQDDITDEIREKRLTKLFAKQGIALEFFGHR